MSWTRLQELTRLAVYRETGERSRLMLDVAGFRAARRAELENIGLEAVEKVKATGEPVALDPMSPFERKVVHDVVSRLPAWSVSPRASMPAVTSWSARPQTDAGSPTCCFT